jgi:predicted AlkP superfamily phosphohydrolase/phosphomutase/tetratricopeptide (TPR) repeat protein
VRQAARWRPPVLLAGTAIAFFLLFFVRIPPGASAVRAWRGGGTPSLVAPGWAFRIPWAQIVDRFDGGTIDVAGKAEAASKEGAAVTLPFELTLHPTSQAVLRLAQEGGTGGARAALADRASGRLREWAASAGTYDLASGRVGDILADRLRDSLLKEDPGSSAEVHLGTPILAPEVQASFARETLFARRADTGINLLLIGLDGADWDVIEPMAARGELPNLARLRRDGAWARLRSSVPTLSPLLWTTVATGKSPDRHGINDFLVNDPRTGRRVPINSTFRRVRAFWNILSEAGLPVDVVAWWATYPAETVRGRLVSDRVSYSTFNISDRGIASRAVYPPDYAAQVETLRVPEDKVAYEEVVRYLHVSREEYRAARQAAGGRNLPEAQTSINVFTRVLAATETYRRVALDLFAPGRPRPRLAAIYFEGIDEVEHRFAHCAPPQAALCPDADYRRFKDAVAQFYRHQDEVLGEILDKAGKDTTTIVLSDHGFASGEGRPTDVKPFIEGKPGLWHDLIGIFAASGPGIHRGEVPAVTLYDILPTVLYLLGLPVADDMSGKVLETAVDPAFLAAHPIAHVPSYEPLRTEARASEAENPAGSAPPDAAPPAAPEGGEANDEMVEQLRSLGYIGGEAGAAAPGPPPATGVPGLLYHTNLAGVYLGKRQIDRAEAELQQALKIDPESPEALVGMAVVHEMRGEPEKAIAILRDLLPVDPGAAPARLLKIADLYARMGRAEDGVLYFESERGKGDEHFETARLVGLGVLQRAAGHDREAEASLRAALQREPDSNAAMQELFTLLDAQGRAVELEPALRQALARKNNLAMFHNWLGLVLKRKGDRKGAEMQFRQTLDAAPDLVGALANLGGLYLEEGRAVEATAALESALSRDPRNIEARANLIVALGMAHDLDGARKRLAEGEAQGQKAPQFYNALAWALHQNGRSDEAREALAKSLQIDPHQPDAQRLAREIESQPADVPYR